MTALKRQVRRAAHPINKFNRSQEEFTGGNRCEEVGFELDDAVDYWDKLVAGWGGAECA